MMKMEHVQGNTVETKDDYLHFVAVDGDWYLGSLLDFRAVKTGLKEMNYVIRNEGIKEQRNLYDATFLLTKKGNVYRYVNWYNPDDDNEVWQADMLDNLNRYDGELKQWYSEAINKRLYSVCLGASFGHTIFFSKMVDPSDICELYGRLAEYANYDKWLVDNNELTGLETFKYEYCKEPQSQNYVYFIRVPSGITKIGCTTNLHNRIRSIQGMCSEPITLLGTIETPEQYKVEESLHEYFTDKQVHGEWYDVSTSDIEQATKQLHYDYQVA